MFLLLFLGRIPSVFFLLRANRETADKAAGLDLASPCSTTINRLRFMRTRVQQCETAPSSPSHNCPSRENQSVKFKRKCTTDWLSRQEWAFQRYRRSHHRTANTGVNVAEWGPPHSIFSEAGCWRKCATNSVLPTEYVLCSQKPIELLLNKELRANSSMFTVAQTEELQMLWSLTRSYFLFRQNGFNVVRFTPCFLWCCHTVPPVRFPHKPKAEWQGMCNID